MATTYCTNDDLILDNGRSVDDFLDATLSKSKKTERKDNARTRAYNYINDRYLKGRTIIPASHISALAQVEVDLIIADFMTGSFSGESANMSEWAARYRERAEEALKNLRFDAASEAATAGSANTGNGTIGTPTVNNNYTNTEFWTLTALNGTYFSVRGSISGSLPNARVGVAYPEKEWTGGSYEDYNLTLSSLAYEEYPIYFTITAGVVDFVIYDRFTFRTYAASYFKQRIGRIIRG